MIEYRISGKDLFIKAADRKEIKTRLCKKLENGGQCGDEILLGQPGTP
jgi:hypothetical protein